MFSTDYTYVHPLDASIELVDAAQIPSASTAEAGRVQIFMDADTVQNGRVRQAHQTRPLTPVDAFSKINDASMMKNKCVHR